MQTLENPWRGQGIDLPDTPLPSTDAETVRALLAQCPAAGETLLVDATALAERVGVERVWVKDERTRMGLGSFKALGAAYVIAHEAVATGAGDLSATLNGRCYVTASAGNHGLSVAAGAKVFGARAVIYLSDTVPEGFAERLRAKGAEVVRAGADYEASMEAAQQAAADNGWTLLSDSSWPGYMDLPHRLMEGYLAMAAEAAEQVGETPTHIYLQAGVGGLAGACAAYFRKIWGNAPRIIVVEPDAAPALYESIRAGRVVDTEGPVSDMGRLDCKTPSMIALAGLSRDADAFALISEEEAQAALPVLAGAGLATTTSGGAGVAAALLDTLPAGARVLCILSEEAEA
ncbi:pyridoxal-phosphate dependent enzyme [Primorskyibacter aestuariivivens]|uniref:pyridoxal-phosphate dependent enzyme n=1 Tax=Primorskyibacter aestuariivivens TaxID=1888912 RepID=UPI002300AEDC|nr:pyridoxal-phosphate dependent enzyme [Primorskyibacter aestuariivivens]MDA7430166.1 pyridoxal-phosphate dependent enzyme [Primorskyibacter aestuariivivens]